LLDALPPADSVGRELHDLIARLYPICRSISGDGVRQSFELLRPFIELDVTEVATGTAAFDWTVPREWNISEAWIADSSGRRIVDFADCNLHVLGYSTPVRARMSLDELRQHVFTHETEPDWIPFRTSYYNERWAFCLSQNQLDAMQPGEYEVCIDSSLEDGAVTYAEAVLPGEMSDEVLVSTYSCHPSLANDNVSGIALLALLGRQLKQTPHRYTYRLLWSPGSIGPISWLARNEPRLGDVKHGLVVSCVGDPGPVTYKRSRSGDAEIDRAVAVVLRDLGEEHRIRDFVPLGGDERQFCSPGINLPMGALSRTPADEFPEYHSSADNLDFVRPDALGSAFGVVMRIFDALEGNRSYLNLSPKGEPQLGKRGLYRSVGGGSPREAALLWVLNLSDGEHDLLAIAERSGLRFDDIAHAASALEQAELLRPL
jgi:aminopeptidase-like protein